MQCKLCEQDRPLRASHVIPKFVGKWLKKISATGYLRQGIQPNLRRQDFPTEPQLCAECETRFSKWEGAFANSIFLPYLDDGKRAFEYGGWLRKFSVSLLWRLANSALEDFRRFDPSLMSYVEHARSAWRLYLLGDEPMEETYGFHLFFTDAIAAAPHFISREKFDWYNRHAVDGTFLSNNVQVYCYVKLPSMIFFAGIEPRRPSKFKNTRIVENGSIRVANQAVLNPIFADFYLDRVLQSWKMFEATSEEQQQKIRDTIEKAG